MDEKTNILSSYWCDLLENLVRNEEAMLRDAKRELGHFLASCYLVYGLNIHPFTSSHLLVLEHKVKGHKT